eukprot:6273595-Prymnesium_polylepis.1
MPTVCARRSAPPRGGRRAESLRTFVHPIPQVARQGTKTGRVVRTVGNPICLWVERHEAGVADDADDAAVAAAPALLRAGELRTGRSSRKERGRERHGGLRCAQTPPLQC